MVTTTRVGMFGLTHPHAAMHLRTFAACERIDGVALADPDPVVRDRVAASYPKTVAVVATLDDLLARSDVLAVSINLPNRDAAPAIARAAAAGKHVLCEKPCARTAAELDPALAALRRHGVKSSAYYVWRSNPAAQKLRALIASGAVGRLTSAELRMVTTQVGVRDPTHWLFRKELAGGGIATWLGCHWLDLLRFVTGQEVERVAALVGNVGGWPIDVEDVASASLQLSGGAIVGFYAGYLLAHGRAGYEGADYDRAFVVRGTEGNLALDDENGEAVVIWEGAGATAAETRTVFRFPQPPSSAYGGAAGLRFVEQFLDAAQSGVGDGPAPLAEARRVLEILDALDESATTGRTVPVRREPLG